MEKKLTLDQIYFQVLRDNHGKPRTDLIPLIMEAAGVPETRAWDAFNHWTNPKRVAEVGMPEWPEEMRRVGDKPKASGEAPVERKAKVESAPVVTKAEPKFKARVGSLKDKPKVTDKTVEELQDLKAKAKSRLKKAKAVADEHPARSANPTAEGVKDFDPVKALAEVAAINEDLDNMPTPDHLVA